MNFIMFICFFPVLPIMYFVLRNDAVPKKNIILGVTLPYEAQNSQDVKAIVSKFKKDINIFVLILTLMAIIPLFISYASVVITFYLIWLIPVIVGFFVPYVLANKKLKKLKAQKGWSFATSEIPSIAIKDLVIEDKPLSLWLFIPPVVLSLIPVIAVFKLPKQEEFWTNFLLYAINLILVVVLYFIYLIQYRQRPEAIDDNLSLTEALTRVRRKAWSKFWIIMAYATGLFNISLWLFMDKPLIFIILALVYSILIIFVVMYCELHVRKLQHELTKQSGTDFYYDEDNYWIGGVIYYNPKDKRLMTNERTGIGVTLNLAKTSAKIIYALTALLILAMPLIGIWTMTEEFTPVSLTLTGSSIEAYHTKRVYEIPLDSIEDIELIYDLPSVRKVSGAGLDTLLKGTFKSYEDGRLKLCLNPQKPPFIKITTEDTSYIFGSDNIGEAKKIYDVISNKP